MNRERLDIQGNLLQTVDPKGCTIGGTRYDMVGNALGENTMDGGEWWNLKGSAARLLFSWDGRGKKFRNQYEAIGHPMNFYL